MYKYVHLCSLYKLNIDPFLFYKRDSVKDSEWFSFWCLIHIIDTNGNSSYIRLLSKNSPPKNENAVVFLNLYEFPSAVGRKRIYWEQYW